MDVKTEVQICFSSKFANKENVTKQTKQTEGVLGSLPKKKNN